jgi:hypothetical protein
MNPSIVHHKVQTPVKTYTNSAPQNQGVVMHSPPQEAQTHEPKNQRKQIVPLRAFSGRAVMGLVDEP